MLPLAQLRGIDGIEATGRSQMGDQPRRGHAFGVCHEAPPGPGECVEPASGDAARHSCPGRPLLAICTPYEDSVSYSRYGLSKQISLLGSECSRTVRRSDPGNARGSLLVAQLPSRKSDALFNPAASIPAAHANHSGTLVRRMAVEVEHRLCFTEGGACCVVSGERVSLVKA